MTQTEGQLPASSGTSYPKLRAIEVIPVTHEGRPMAYLRDPADPAGSTLAVSQHALALISLMDGARSLDEIQSTAISRWDLHTPLDALTELVQALDDAYFLENDRFVERREYLRAEFLSLPLRPSIHAGGAYPADPTALQQFIAAQITAPTGPGITRSGFRRPAVSAAIIPHVDLHRGGPTYAWAYQALAEAPPADTYLLLGTCHTPMSQPFSALRVPYETPFGPAPLDLDMIERLRAKLGPGLVDDPLPHRAEHSLELQMVYLRALELASDNGGKVVPILCHALQSYVAAGRCPRDTRAVRDFIEAVRTAIDESGRSVCLIAAADLAHVGPQFGDCSPVDPAVLDEVGQRDRQMLRLICEGNADGFYAQVMEDGDARRICGLAPIYYALAIHAKPGGELLRYTQWADPDGNSAVTFASVVF